MYRREGPDGAVWAQLRKTATITIGRILRRFILSHFICFCSDLNFFFTFFQHLPGSCPIWRHHWRLLTYRSSSCPLGTFYTYSLAIPLRMSPYWQLFLLLLLREQRRIGILITYLFHSRNRMKLFKFSKMTHGPSQMMSTPEKTY